MHDSSNIIQLSNGEAIQREAFMERTIITIREYCAYHEPVAPDFIQSLIQSGLIRQAEEESEPSIYFEELRSVERFTRLHYDLEINLPGIETIEHLLEQVRALQEEVSRLRARQILDV